MTDIAGTIYGRSWGMLYTQDIDPWSVGPAPIDAQGIGSYIQKGSNPRGRWQLYNGNWAMNPPVPSASAVAQVTLDQSTDGAYATLPMTMPMSANPHTVWDTAKGISSTGVPFVPEGAQYRNLRYPAYSSTRVYNYGECVLLPSTFEAVAMSIRDENLNHTPAVSIPHLAGNAYINLNPDWWMIFGYDITGNYLFHNPTNWNFGPPGVTSRKGYVAGPRNVWSGAPAEAGTLVGANQWASGECQADWIGPMVRSNPATGTGYFTYAEYNNVLNNGWLNYDSGLMQAGDIRPACEITAQNCRLTLARQNVDGSVTILQRWQNIMGPWCVRLMVADNLQGQPVLYVWQRFWGYDPYERDLDVWPWNFVGSYVDTDATKAIHTGQPGFFTVEKPYHVAYVDGETWWAWGELGGVKPPKSQTPFMLQGSTTVITTADKDNGFVYIGSQVLTLTANESSIVNYRINGGVWSSGNTIVVVPLSIGSYSIDFYSIPNSGTAAEQIQTVTFTIVPNSGLASLTSIPLTLAVGAISGIKGITSINGLSTINSVSSIQTDVNIITGLNHNLGLSSIDSVSLTTDVNEIQATGLKLKTAALIRDGTGRQVRIWTNNGTSLEEITFRI